MMVSPQGTADPLVRHLKPEDVAGDDGKNLIYKTLESSPLVVELDHVSEDRTQKEFLKLRRTSGESMDSYTARAQLYRSTLLAEDAGFEVGDRFFVGFLLDNAEITLRDRAMVMNAAGHLNTIEAVIPALRRLGPLLQGSAPIGRSGHDRPVLPWPGTQAPAARPDSGSANSGRWAPRKSNSYSRGRSCRSRP